MSHQRFENHRSRKRSRGELEHLAAVVAADEKGGVVEAAAGVLFSDEIFDRPVDNCRLPAGVQKREDRKGRVQMRLALVPECRSVGAKQHRSFEIVGQDRDGGL